MVDLHLLRGVCGTSQLDVDLLYMNGMISAIHLKSYNGYN